MAEQNELLSESADNPGGFLKSSDGSLKRRYTCESLSQEISFEWNPIYEIKTRIWTEAQCVETP